MTPDEKRRYVEDSFRQEFDEILPRMVNRSIRLPIQTLGPAQYFARPTLECRKMFVHEHFFGCISLAQAVAEGIARFLLEKNPSIVLEVTDNHEAVINVLQHNSSSAVISPLAFAAFKRIREPRKNKEDRNTFHHLLDDIELNPKKLEVRAEQCLLALHEIESEVFGYSVVDGRIVPKCPQYWPTTDVPGTVRVMVRR